MKGKGNAKKKKSQVALGPWPTDANEPGQISSMHRFRKYIHVIHPSSTAFAFFKFLLPSTVRLVVAEPLCTRSITFTLDESL